MPGLKPTMSEFSRGALHSGSKTGPVVTNPKQAVAIAFSEKRKRRAKQRQTFGDIAKRLDPEGAS